MLVCGTFYLFTFLNIYSVVNSGIDKQKIDGIKLLKDEVINLKNLSRFLAQLNLN